MTNLKSDHRTFHPHTFRFACDTYAVFTWGHVPFLKIISICDPLREADLQAYLILWMVARRFPIPFQPTQPPHQPLETAHCAHTPTRRRARSLSLPLTPTNRTAGDFKHTEKQLDLLAECPLLVISVLSSVAHGLWADQLLPSEAAGLTQRGRKHLRSRPAPASTHRGGVLGGPASLKNHLALGRDLMPVLA